MKKILICWNKSKYADRIKVQIEKMNIEVKLCSDFKSLDATEYKADYMIVLCELKWSHKIEMAPYSDLNGIKLVQYLRREKEIKIPILFLSFLSRKIIIDMQPDAEIISTTALKHRFLQIPPKSKEWLNELLSLTVNKDLKKSIKKAKSKSKAYIEPNMSDLELRYTKRRFCDTIGLLEQINHDISGCKTSEKLNEKLKKLNFANESIGSVYKTDIDELSEKINVENINCEKIYEKFKELCKKIIDLLKDKKNITDAEKEYFILYLEDEYNKNDDSKQNDPRIEKLIATFEEKHFRIDTIKKPEYSRNSLQYSDNTRKYDAVICDVEIWETGKNGEKSLDSLGFNYIKWLKSQGFDFIYIILSNVTRNLYSEILNSIKDINAYSKDDALSSDASIRVFVDGIRNLLDRKKEKETDYQLVFKQYLKHIQENEINFILKDKQKHTSKTYTDVQNIIDEKVNSLIEKWEELWEKHKNETDLKERYKICCTNNQTKNETIKKDIECMRGYINTYFGYGSSKFYKQLDNLPTEKNVGNFITKLILRKFYDYMCHFIDDNELKDVFYSNNNDADRYTISDIACYAISSENKIEAGQQSHCYDQILLF